jgi:hypothetical protein
MKRMLKLIASLTGVALLVSGCVVDPYTGLLVPAAPPVAFVAPPPVFAPDFQPGPVFAPALPPVAFAAPLLVPPLVFGFGGGGCCWGGRGGFNRGFVGGPRGFVAAGPRGFVVAGRGGFRR